MFFRVRSTIIGPMPLFSFDRQVRGMEGRKRAGLMLMEFWMEEEENRRKAEEFKIRR